jgi:hypothetical protein
VLVACLAQKRFVVVEEPTFIQQPDLTAVFIGKSAHQLIAEPLRHGTSALSGVVDSLIRYGVNDGMVHVPGKKDACRKTSEEQESASFGIIGTWG